jgi:hypothetical protein
MYGTACETRRQFSGRSCVLRLGLVLKCLDIPTVVA